MSIKALLEGDKKTRGLLIGLLTAVCSIAYAPDAFSAVELAPGLKLSGDARARYEQADRTTSTGADSERERFRYRLRLGLTYQAHDMVELGFRLASDAASPEGGTDAWDSDANSPHVTIGDNGFKRDAIYIDKAYLKANYMGGFAWFGKNDMPFWEQNEYYWDADINPEGIGLGYTYKNLGPVSVTLQGGYFIVDEIGFETSGGNDDSTATVYQAVVKGGVDPVDVTVSYGALSLSDGVSSTSCDTSSTDCNYSQASIQAKIKSIPGIAGAAFTLGYDLLGSDASANDKGSVISGRIDYGNFRAEAKYADMEANAGPGRAGLSQDDWPSFKADFTGTEFVLGYKISDNMDVDLKRFDGEDKDLSVGSNNKEETLTQVNFNVKF